MQRQVHPSLIVEEAALEYIESLIIRLLAMLCSGQPHSVQHLEDRVQKTFPHPIDQWAINEARGALEKKSKQEGKKKTPTTVLPIDKIHPLLKVCTITNWGVYTWFHFKFRCDITTDIEGRSHTSYTALCNGIVSHGALIRGIQVLADKTRRNIITNKIYPYVRSYLSDSLA